MEEMKWVPSLENFAEPSSFVHAYKDLEVSEYIGRLAPSLGLVITHSLYNPAVTISREFIDPETFLGMTHWYPAILKALSLINKNLKAGQGAITLPLTQEMGFGKTHFLTLLWHLYTQTPRIWRTIRSKIELEDVVDKLTEKAYYKSDIAARALVLPVDLKTLPEFMDPYAALFESCARTVEEYGKLEEEIGKRKLATFTRNLAKREPKSAAREFAKFLREQGMSIPVLILLDELYASVYEAAQGEDETRIASLADLILFVTSFADELREYCPVALIYASAQQDINRWSTLVKIKERLIKERPAVANLVNVVEHFEDRTSRVQINMGQTTPEDVIKVALKRLFRLKLPRKEAIKPVSERCVEIVKDILGGEAASSYYQGLLTTYPLAPTYRFLAEKLLAPTIGGDLPRTQHVRDLLKITAVLVARVYEAGEWDKASLVSPAYLVHDDVNHLLQERYAQEWGRLYEACLKSIEEIKDEKAKSLAEKMLSIVYIKSLTTNITKLLDMIRASEAMPRGEVLTRGTSPQDLVFSLVGAVPRDHFTKFHEAIDYLANSTPYVVPVEHAGRKYTVMSFLVNPLELVESFTREEKSQYTSPEGQLNYKQMVEYLRRHLEIEYQITSRFAEVSQKEDKPKLVLVNYDAFIDGIREKPKFMEYLDRNRFTALITTPWSTIEQELEKGPVDPVEEIRDSIQRHKGDISYTNMFAVIIPKITKENLESLCSRVAEVHASAKVVSYFKVKEVSEARKRRLELARRAPTYKTLLDLSELEERRLEDIIIEIMDSLQKKIEAYAESYTNTAVRDYVGDLVGAFGNIVYYNLADESFKKGTIDIRYEVKEGFEKVYAELPTWISDAVIRKCGVDRRNSIMSKFIEYAVTTEVKKQKDELLSGQKLTLDTDPYIEAMMRGWKELPIRPLSRKDAETALRLISGTYIVNVQDVPHVKVSPVVTTEDGKEVTRIVIEIPIRPPGPPGPPGPPPEQVEGMLIGGVNDVIIGMELLKEDRLGSNIKNIDLGVKTIGGCWFKLESAAISDLTLIFGSGALNVLVNRLSSISPELEHAELLIRLTEPMKKEDAEKILDVVGVSRKSVSLRAA